MRPSLIDRRLASLAERAREHVVDGAAELAPQHAQPRSGGLRLTFALVETSGAADTRTERRARPGEP